MARIPSQIADYIRGRIFVANGIATFLSQMAIPGYRPTQVSAYMTGIPEDLYEGGTIEIGDQFVEFHLEDAEQTSGFDVKIRVTHLSDWSLAIEITCPELTVRRIIKWPASDKQGALAQATAALTDLSQRLNA
jgi:hypothetical protein